MPGDRFIRLAEAEGQRLLHALFGSAAEGVTVQDADGRLIYANDHAGRMLGLRSGSELMTASVATLVGSYEMLDAAGDPIGPERLPGRRVLVGEDVAEEVIGYRSTRDRKVRWSRVRASPVKDDTGRAVWAINYFHDITDQVRRAAADRLLSQVNQVLGSSLDVEVNLQVLADILVPEVADWYGVHLVDDHGGLVNVAAKFPDLPEAAALVKLTGQDRLEADSDSLAARVARTGAPEVIHEISDVALAAADPRVAELVRAVGIAAIACLPLGTMDRPIGTLTVVRSNERPPFDDLDLDVLDDISRGAAVALVNSRLFEQEHRVADLLSRSLVPKMKTLEVDGLSTAALHRNSASDAGLGGDFVETVARDDGSLLILVADIEGKGIEAAAAVGVVRHTFRAVASLDPAPDVVASQINEALLNQDETRMCTFAYLWLRPTEGGNAELTVALSGHPPPLLLKADGAIIELGSPCPPAGLLPEIIPTSHVQQLVPGDRVMCYTDGFALREETPPETMHRLLQGVAHQELAPLFDELLKRLDATRSAVDDDILLFGFEILESDT